MDRIYKFEYVPVGSQSTIVRYIDLSYIIAIGLFGDVDIVGIQIDCKLRDAPLVIDVLSKSHFLLEAEKLIIEMNKLVDAWRYYQNYSIKG